jgi:hypothetical protein
MKPTSIEEVMEMVRQKVAEDAVAAGQMTLGGLLGALAPLDSDMPIVVDFTDSAPGDFDSYRGYYEQIAFEEHGSHSTVAAFLREATEALGETMTGYKGGDFVMHRQTPVWASSYGRCSGMRLVGVDVVDGRVVLRTASDESNS